MTRVIPPPSDPIGSSGDPGNLGGTRSRGQHLGGEHPPRYPPRSNPLDPRLAKLDPEAVMAPIVNNAVSAR